MGENTFKRIMRVMAVIMFALVSLSLLQKQDTLTFDDIYMALGMKEGKPTNGVTSINEVLYFNTKYSSDYGIHAKFRIAYNIDGLSEKDYHTYKTHYNDSIERFIGMSLMWQITDSLKVFAYNYNDNLESIKNSDELMDFTIKFNKDFIDKISEIVYSINVDGLVVEDLIVDKIVMGERTEKMFLRKIETLQVQQILELEAKAKKKSLN